MPKCTKNCNCGRHKTPSNFKDITGKRFGRLIVVRRIKNKKDKWQTIWLCKCSCGNFTKVNRGNLYRDHTRSCGCLQSDLTRKRNKPRHGHCTNNKSTRIYRVWSSMLERCRRSTHPAFKHYGGRGITVCRRWLTFENFLVDMGPKPKNKSIDRINNDKGYSLANCRWATWNEQANNKRAKAQGK